MNDMPMYIAAGIGVLLIILGFVALLAQRIYFDPKTQTPIEIDIPILGKMKANYPALIFVFLGCALAIYGVSQAQESEVQWQVDGMITADMRGLDWQQGHLAVFPSKLETNIEADTGKFTIRLAIEEGKTLEDVIERIDYSHRNGNVIFFPKKEFEQYKNNKPTILLNATNRTRTYKVHLEQLPPPLK
jgi:hypothetical protein